MNKRGLSQVVAMILIILIVIVAVSIIWAVVRLTIESGVEGVGIEYITINMEIIGQSVFINDTNVLFKVKRNPGKGDVIGLKVVLEDVNEKKELFDILDFDIEELETMSVMISNYRDEGLIDISEISIAPVFSSNGREVVGNIVDVYVVRGLEGDEVQLSWPPQGFQTTKSYSYAWRNDTIYKNNIDNIVGVYHIGSFNTAPWHINRIKAATDAMPAGHKVVLPREFMYHHPDPNWDSHIAMHAHPDDGCIDPDTGEFVNYTDPYTGESKQYVCIWWDNGTRLAIEKFGTLFTKLEDEEVEIDVVLLDSETWLDRWGAINNSLPDDIVNGFWQAVENDPRFAGAEENISQQLIDMGYVPPWARLNDTVWKYKDNAICEGGYNCYDNYLVWGSLMLERIAAYRTRAIFDVIRQYYPDITMSDYDIFYWNSSFAFPGPRGHKTMKYGSGAVTGTHQSWQFYAHLGNIANTGLGYFQNIPYNSFRYEVNKMRAMYLARPDIPIQPWVGTRSWPGNPNMGIHLLQNTDLHQEMIIHLGLIGADPVLYFNAFGNEADDLLHSNILKEIDLMIGYDVEKQTLITNLTDWTNDFVYTGMRVGEFKVWRFTPEVNITLGETVNDTLISSGNVNELEEVIFQVDTTQIIFPNATIYIPENFVSQQGHWVIQLGNAGEPYVVQ
ncbi:MAG: hypothetical protein IIA87_03925 [Nanoarchaeota archaeon]|nr:hypothetical protein [Nanoarchaeota archaeon]